MRKNIMPPEFKIDNIDFKSEDLVKHIKNWNSYVSSWLKWRNLVTKLSLSKNDIKFIKNSKPEIKFTNSSRINPAFLGFITMYHLRHKFNITSKVWKESAIGYFDHLKTSLEGKISPHHEVLKLPGYENRVEIIALPFKKETPYDVRGAIDEIFDTIQIFNVESEIKSFDSLVSLAKAAGQSKAEMAIKYIAQEVIANIHEHAKIGFEKKINLADICVYSDFDWFYMTISDPGITIPGNVKNTLGKDVTNLDAVKWAFKKFNTTKTKSNGGMGLNDIIFLANQLEAEVTVLSNNIETSLDDGKLIYKEINYNLNGTIFIMKFPQRTMGKDIRLVKKLENTTREKIEGVFK